MPLVSGYQDAYGLRLRASHALGDPGHSRENELVTGELDLMLGPTNET